MTRKITLAVCLAALSICCGSGKGDNGGDPVNPPNPPNPPQQPKQIITGYIPDYTINVSSPGDLSYLQIPDRIYFFGNYPSETGEWQTRGNIAQRLAIVRVAMIQGQELFCVAGGGASATPSMHVMGRDPLKREAYATALVNYAHQNQFDGIDMDWETDWSKSPAVKVRVADFVDLITLIRTKMNALPSGTRVKKLTTALATQSDSRELGNAVKELIDQINVMVYDVYGSQAAGYPHAPMDLFTAAMENYVSAGVPKAKLLGGVPFYGGNKSVSPTQTKTYRELYYAASPAIIASTNSSNNFAFNGPDLIREKTRWVVDNDYAGMMIWELSQDIPSTSAMSLLRTMKNAISE
ncbi:hypothetical protein FACS1894159_03730 [Bacteroidia bacterium]|nr:hypothetical protein FACS1894159_03730 [Bacteroidia bacterium]